MHKLHYRLLSVCLFASISTHGLTADTELNVAIIGGLEMSGVWPLLESRAEEALGMQITTRLTAPKEQVVPAFIRGEVNALLIHGGDETFALESLGYAEALRTWGYNEFVFVGPASDPADLAGAVSGKEAMLKLQSSGAPLISFRDIASQQIIRRLLDSAGLFPRDINLIPDTAGRPQQILLQAERDQAYVIVGHMPVAFNRMPSGDTKIVLSGDPAMRRAYVVVTPGMQHPATAAARNNATRLADFLVSEEGQDAIAAIGRAGTPWIFPRDAAGALLNFE
ncbi:MAG: hypothetical protein O2971_19130 [Proteobacteria bacterium]|nr:hypothetical protein [Pseudomonadota bacterium]